LLAISAKLLKHGNSGFPALRLPYLSNGIGNIFVMFRVGSEFFHVVTTIVVQLVVDKVMVKLHVVLHDAFMLKTLERGICFVVVARLFVGVNPLLLFAFVLVQLIAYPVGASQNLTPRRACLFKAGQGVLELIVLEALGKLGLQSVIVVLVVCFMDVFLDLVGCDARVTLLAISAKLLKHGNSGFPALRLPYLSNGIGNIFVMFRVGSEFFHVVTTIVVQLVVDKVMVKLHVVLHDAFMLKTLERGICFVVVARLFVGVNPLLLFAFVLVQLIAYPVGASQNLTPRRACLFKAGQGVLELIVLEALGKLGLQSVIIVVVGFLSLAAAIELGNVHATSHVPLADHNAC